MTGTSKYYYRQKAYLANYERNQRERGYKRCSLWMTPEQWGVVHAFANEIRKLRYPEKIVGLDVSSDRKTFKLVMKDSVKQTDEEFFKKHRPKDYSDIPLYDPDNPEQDFKITPDIIDKIK